MKIEEQLDVQQSGGHFGCQLRSTQFDKSSVYFCTPCQLVFLIFFQMKIEEQLDVQQSGGHFGCQLWSTQFGKSSAYFFTPCQLAQLLYFYHPCLGWEHS